MCVPTKELSSSSHMRCSMMWRSSGASSRKSGMISSSALAYRIAPCTFLLPGYSPRSICSTFRPALARVYAQALPEGPAPTTMASNWDGFFMACPLGWEESGDAPAALREMLREGPAQRRQHLQRVADDAVVREVEDRCVRIGVDRH